NDSFNLGLDNSGLRRILATVNGVTTTYQAAGGGDILNASIDKITVDAGDGSDNLFVDLTNGAFPDPLDPQFEAGPGNDRLFISGGTADFDNYTLFPTPGFGQSQIVMGGVNQFISNRDVENVYDFVGQSAASPFAFNATAADNSIDYTDAGFPF